MIVMIDMGLGNLQSVRQAFLTVGQQLTVTSDPAEIEAANAVILPGVGAFGDGMASLHRFGLVDPLRRHALEKKRPILGICLGMQLLADEGTEFGDHRGLGIVAGRVVKLKEGSLRVPNIGWCDVTPSPKKSVLFGETVRVEAFYFAHSFYLEARDEAIVAATIDYGATIAVAIEARNVFGVQFHPEKSQEAGLSVLDRFLTHARAVAFQ